MQLSDGCSNVPEHLQHMISDFAHHAHNINFLLSFISLILNLFHLFILLRKSMRTTSTFVILIGIAISDIFTTISTIYKRIGMEDNENPQCLTSNSFLQIYIDVAVWSLQEHFRRCSSWLGVCCASVRYFIIKNATKKKKCSTAGFGWILIIVLNVSSLILSMVYHMRFQVIQDSNKTLPIICAEFQNIHEPLDYTLTLSPFFKNQDYLILRAFRFIKVIVSKFLPCLAFPILTILLLRELKRIKNVERSQRKRNSVTSIIKSELTTKLIVFMTIAYFIAEAPLGCINLIRVFYDDEDRVVLFSVDITIYFTVLLTINSISHSMFCYLMSSQYRETVNSTFSGKPNQNATFRSETTFSIWKMRKV